MNEELKIIIEAETAKLQKACDEATKDIQKLSQNSTNYGKKIGEAFKKAGKVAMDATKTIAKGVGVAAGALVGLTAKAVSSAGELEQNIGGSEQVFKEFSENIQDYAKSAYENLGLSTSDYLATANKMGALLQGSGFTIQESMNLSAECMQRASDVASIMGIDVSSAMEAVAGAAKGNFTMMDNLGVAMNATTIEAYALSKGIETSYNEMSNQQKTALALEMFMEKTAYATGNYAKENKTLAGSLNTAKAAFTNFLDGSGDVDQFVDAVSNAGSVILKNVILIAPRIMEGVSGILNGIIPMIPQFMSELLPVILNGAIGLMENLVASLPAIIETLQESLPIIINGIYRIIEQVMISIGESLPLIVEAVVSVLPMITDRFLSSMATFIELGVQIITALLQGLTESMPGIIDAVIEMIPTIVNVFTDSIPALLEAGIEFFMAIVDAIPEFLPDLIEMLPEIIDQIITTLLDNIPLLLESGITLFLAIVDAIPEIIPALVEAIPEIISNIVDTLINNIPLIVEAGVELFMGLVESIPKIIPALINGLADIVSTVTTNLVNKLLDLMGFDWELPKLKLPHVNIEGKFSLAPPSIPKFSIDWYAQGGVFDETHLFPYGNGSIGGLGENGAEAVVPLEKNTQWLDRIAERLRGDGQPVILMIDGKVFGEVAVDSINGITAQRGSIPLRIM